MPDLRDKSLWVGIRTCTDPHTSVDGQTGVVCACTTGCVTAWTGLESWAVRERILFYSLHTRNTNKPCMGVALASSEHGKQNVSLLY